jgi:hypothetical protein
VPGIFKHGGGNLIHLHSHIGQHYVSLKINHGAINRAKKYTTRSAHAKCTEFVTCEKIVHSLLSSLKFMCHKNIRQLLLFKLENPTKGNQYSLANSEHAKPNLVRYELI